jgi:hypothetical protein
MAYQIHQRIRARRIAIVRKAITSPALPCCAATVRSTFGGVRHCIGMDEYIVTKCRFSASRRHRDLNKSTMNIPSECRTASIGSNHAMILPHDANPKPAG